MADEFNGVDIMLFVYILCSIQGFDPITVRVYTCSKHNTVMGDAML
jgi:hypothetical protein